MSRWKSAHSAVSEKWMITRGRPEACEASGVCCPVLSKLGCSLPQAGSQGSGPEVVAARGGDSVGSPESSRAAALAGHSAKRP